MNITEALGEITAQFPRVERSLDAAGETPAAVFEVASGGIRAKARDPEPTLYLTSDAAVRAWRDQVLGLLNAEKAARFTVLDGPHLDRWRITVADGKYTHRTAEDRYSVTARIGVIREITPAVEPPVAETAAPELPKPKPAKAAKKKAA